MANFKHIIKDFVVEVNDKVRHDAILDVCRRHDYNFDDCEQAVIVYAYISPTELATFFDEIDAREYELNHRVDIGLTEEQKIVLNKVMLMLADANIGLCHDYKSTGELMAFNSVDGNVYACDDTDEEDEVWYSEDEIKGTPSVLPNTLKGKRIYSFYCNGGFAIKKEKVV